MTHPRNEPRRVGHTLQIRRGHVKAPRAGEEVMRAVREQTGQRTERGEGPSQHGPAGAPSKDSLSEVSRLFANTADGVWVSGAEGEILFWNVAAESIMGYPAEQVLGKYCRDVFCGCDANGNRLCGWPCPIKALAHGGDLVEHFDMATHTKAGQPLWIDVSCVAVPRGDDRPPTLVHLFRDVTAAHQIELLVRQQLAQTKLRLTTTADTLPRIAELSQRELQVISLMREGASTAAIADQLFISKATARNHIQNIFSKLKVHTRLEAVAYVNQIAQRGPTTRTEAGSVPALTTEGTKVAVGGDRKARDSR